MKEIESKGGWLIRGNVANELAQIHRKHYMPLYKRHSSGEIVHAKLNIYKEGKNFNFSVQK